MTRQIAVLTVVFVLSSWSVRADEKRPATKASPEGGALQIGAVAYSPDSVTIFRALRHYFARSGMPVEFVLYSTYDGLNDALARSQVDVAWNTPLGHAKFHLKAGASQTLVMRDVDVAYRVKLIARKDAGITSLAGLAGKSMVFGSCEAADSTVLPIHYLRKEGVDIDKLKIVSLHDEVDALGCPCHSQQHVLEAMLKGRGQAGILGSDTWKRLQKTKPEQAALLQEVWTSPPFSHCVFTARADFSKEAGTKFTKLMLAMDQNDPLTAEILRLEGCSRWVAAEKAAQAGFADLLTALREGPAVSELLRKSSQTQSTQTENKTLRIHAQSEWKRKSAGGPRRVARSAAELVKLIPPLDAGLAPEAAEKEIVAAAARELKVNDIDWKTQMVVVLFGGEPSTNGVKVGFTKLAVRDGTLTIHGFIRVPGVKSRIPGAATTLIGLVDRFDGPVAYKMETIALP